MKSWQIGLAAVIATGSILYVQDRRQRSAAEQARTEIATLSASIAELEAKRGDGDAARAWIASRAPLDSSAVRPAAALLSKPPAEGDAQRPPSHDKRPPTRTAKEIAEYQDLTFRQQPTDLAWAQPAEGRISSTMRQMLQDPAMLRSISCHESICRVEASVGAGDESAQIVRRMVEDGIWDGQISIFSTTDADDNVTVTAYLVRQGYARPLPDRQL